MYSFRYSSILFFTAFAMAQLRAPVHSVHLLFFAIAVLILATILSRAQAKYVVLLGSTVVSPYVGMARK